MANFNPDNKAVLDDILLRIPLVRAGKMFGFPAYFVGKNLFMCVYEDGIGIKLPVQSVASLLETDPNVTIFQPYGRHKMREWVQITLSEAEAYRKYEPVLHESIQYLLSKQDA